MSVIFQLFRAEDLVDLDEKELEDFRKAIGAATRQYGDVDLKAALDVSRSTEAELQLAPPPPGTTPEFIARLRERAREVFPQLMGEPPGDPPAPYQGQEPPSIFAQLLSPEDFRRLNDTLGNKGRTILMWAIICEAANLKYYNALRRIQSDGQQEIRRSPSLLGARRRFKDPDSEYSPFNPRHPFYGSNPS